MHKNIYDHFLFSINKKGFYKYDVDVSVHLRTQNLGHNSTSD